MSRYQLLPPLSDSEYAALRDDIRSAGVRVPIDVDGQGNILDGHHRKAIADELGVECPERVIRDLPEFAKVDYALSVNLARRHLDQDGKRALVRASLKRDPRLADREHARRCGVSHPFVAGLREALEAAGQLETVTSRIGGDGRERQLPTQTAGAGLGGPAPAPQDHPGSSSPGEGAASAAAQEEDSGSALGGSSSTAAGAVTPAAPAAPEHLTSVADGAGPGDAADVQPAAAAAAGEPAKPAAAPDPGVAAPAEETDAASSHDSSGEQGGPATSPAGPSCEKCGTDIDDDGYRRCSGCDPDGMHTASDAGGCRLCALLATVPDEYLPIQVGEGVHGLQLECGCGAVVAHLKPGMPIAVALIEARLHHGSCQWSAT